uniref:Uncharacterized protein n=1 Tax=Panagrolaimus davidi TaxID=227884 RepID=A0A914QZI6_9BILA
MNNGVHTPDWYEIGTTGGDNSGDSGSGYQYQQPIYGNTGYTYGQVNQMYNVNTGSNSGDYNGYSNNYWTCVNQYRGQYYYSYTYGKYICDARANRYGSSY